MRRDICYDVIHDGDNVSDHDSIFIWLDVDLTYSKSSPNDIVSKPSKLCWRKAKISAISAYQRLLSKSLRSVRVPFEAIQCCDPMCVELEKVTV